MTDDVHLSITLVIENEKTFGREPAHRLRLPFFPISLNLGANVFHLCPFE